MRDERECVICGAHYSYCPNCIDYIKQPRWKFLFHDKNCHDIYAVLNDYNAQVITKDEAAAKLKSLNLSGVNSFRKDFRDQINEIIGGGTNIQPQQEVQTAKPKPYHNKSKYAKMNK